MKKLTLLLIFISTLIGQLSNAVWTNTIGVG